MGSDFEINTESKKFESEGDFQIVKANDKYLITSLSNYIDIYDLNKNLDIKYKKSIISKQSQDITNLDFNPDYPELFLSSHSDGNIKIWNINDLENNSNKEFSIIKAHDTAVKNSLFNPIYGNIVISSDLQNIKLWDLTKYIYSQTILNQKNITNLQWDPTGEYYGYINNDIELLIREKNNNEKIISIKENLKNFLFKSHHEIFTFSENSIKLWDIRDTQKVLKENLVDIKRSTKILYNINYDYFYFITCNLIKIFDIDKFNVVYTKIDKNIFGQKPILLNDSFIKNKEISNILDLISGDSTIIKVIQKKENKKSNSPIIKTNSKDYFHNIAYVISDYKNIFKFEENNIYDLKLKIKKYFMIPEIKQELIRLNNETIFERREYVEKELIQKKKFRNINEQYLYYLKLLIRDNTNKLLIKEYLKFLKLNENEIKKRFKNLEEYQNEILFYKVCFSQDELKELGEGKDKSEKQEFIQLLQDLNDIKNLANICSFQRLRNIDEISFFNQPIDLNNEELFYYKSKTALCFNIMTNKDFTTKINKFKLKQDLIKKILERNLFENKEIIKNIDKLNLLNYLIIDPQEDGTNEYILNLLSSNKFNINEIDSDKNFERIVSKGKDSIIINKKVFYLEDLKNMCKDNFMKFVLNKKNQYKDEDIFSYEFILNKINSELYACDIKNFLKIILKSQVFKDAFELLYSKEYLNFFNNESLVSEIIDKHLKFVPFSSDNSCGFTDIFTFNSYIFIEDKPITYHGEFIKDVDKNTLIEDALKIGRAIIITFNELNHNLHSYLLNFYISINYTFQTPTRNKISKFREGGYYLEYLLFGRIIENLTLEEAMFLMNVDSYKKDLKTFNREFSNLNENISINGVFSKFNCIKTFDRYDDIKKTSINIRSVANNSFLKNISIDIKTRKNCILGINRKFDVKAFNEFFKNSH